MRGNMNDIKKLKIINIRIKQLTKNFKEERDLNLIKKIDGKIKNEKIQNIPQKNKAKFL